MAQPQVPLTAQCQAPSPTCNHTAGGRRPESFPLTIGHGCGALGPMTPRQKYSPLVHICLGLFLLVLTAQAEVKLHNLFSDGMVLQRDTTVPIWGWADNDEQVTVEFRGKKAS